MNYTRVTVTPPTDDHPLDTAATGEGIMDDEDEAARLIAEIEEHLEAIKASLARQRLRALRPSA